MMSTTDRAYAMAVEHYGKARRDRLAHPFGLAEGDPCRFRVSPDVYQALVLELRHPEYVVAQRGDDRLFGLPVDVDATLPPESMLLSPTTP
jgi:hypothetical protein